MGQAGGIVMDQITSYEMAISVACDADLCAKSRTAAIVRRSATLEDMLLFCQLDELSGSKSVEAVV